MSLGTSGTAFAVSSPPAGRPDRHRGGLRRRRPALPAAGLHAQLHAGRRPRGRVAAASTATPWSPAARSSCCRGSTASARRTRRTPPPPSAACATTPRRGRSCAPRTRARSPGCWRRSRRSTAAARHSRTTPRWCWSAAAPRAPRGGETVRRLSGRAVAGAGGDGAGRAGRSRPGGGRARRASTRRRSRSAGGRAAGEVLDPLPRDEETLGRHRQARSAASALQSSRFASANPRRRVSAPGRSRCRRGPRTGPASERRTRGTRTTCSGPGPGAGAARSWAWRPRSR